jgi:hypothetical protein
VIWNAGVLSSAEHANGVAMSESEPSIFGVAAEFDSPEAILRAAKAANARGYRRVEAYTPYAVKELADHLGFEKTRVPLLVLCGGVLGAVGGFFMLWYANVVSYPWNIGGRPPNSWPAFIPISFEMMVLGASLMAFFGALVLNGLPMLYHPMFNLPRFDLASQSRFFLCIESRDKRFDAGQVRAFLESLQPTAVMEVPW